MIGLVIAAVPLTLLLLIWAVFRSHGYKRVLLDAPPGPGWQSTNERFVDPGSGAVAVVWYSPASGQRVYVRQVKSGQPDAAA